MTRPWYADLPKYYQRQIRAAGLDEAGIARRRALKAMGAGAAATVLMGSLTGRARAAAALQYMAWEGYNDPRIIAPFQQANDVEVSFDLIVDSPGGFAKLQAGASREIDIVSTDMPWVTRMGPAGLAMPLDASEFAGLYAQFYEQFRPPFEPLQHEGNTIGVATRWGWVCACINTEHDSVENWRSGYDPVFDPANRGKICMMDWGDWPILPLALHAGINPYEELDEAALDEIRTVLHSAFANDPIITPDLTQAQKGLLDGSLKGCIGAGSYLTSALRKQGHMNITSFVPEPKNGVKQGVVWVEATAILNETDQPELARALLRHVVSPEAGKFLALLDSTSNVVTNAEVEFTPQEQEILQMDYMWTAYDNSEMHRIAPNIDDMLAIWAEELVAAQ